MFRPTDPQISMLECQYLMPPEKRCRLEKSWAHPFRTVILPLINEEAFRAAFSEDKGRPNKSIRLLSGLHLLKEWNDLTDEEVLNQLEFNLQWHYALGIESEEAHTCQKSLHNYRMLLMQNDRAQQMFESLARGLAEADELHLGRQRLDSTHVISNIAVLTRLGLFVETVSAFLKELRREAPERLAKLDSEFRHRYLDREGYFADVKREQARRRLPVVARDIYDLLQTFEAVDEVRRLASYGLLRRLFQEQCEVIEQTPETGGKTVQTVAVDAEAPVVPPKTDSPPVLQPESGASSAASPVMDAMPETAAEADSGAEAETASDTEADADAKDAADIEATSDTEAAADAKAAADTEDAADAKAAADSETAADIKAAADTEDAADAKAAADTEASSNVETAAKPGAENAAGSKPTDEPQYGIRLKQGKELRSDSLQSPYDPDATYGRKGKGYETQVAETCDPTNPYQIITGISVNGAHESDQHATVAMAQQLQDSGLKPDELFADTGYGSGGNIIDCADMDVFLRAPVQDPAEPREPETWTAPVKSASEDAADPQASVQQAPRIGLEDFHFSLKFDEIAGCPLGRIPKQQHLDSGGKKLWALFDGEHCAKCPFADCCPTRPKKSGDRVLRVLRATAATAVQQCFQRTDAFREPYKIRSGIEATNSELKGKHGADDLRVRGQDRVTITMMAKAMAANVKRAVLYHVKALRLSEAAEQVEAVPA